MVLALAWDVGVVVPGFRHPLALAAAFVLVVTASMLGIRRIDQWVQQLRPLQTLVVVVVVVVVALLALLWLISPTTFPPPVGSVSRQ